MDTLGNFSEYMSIANDYASCAEGDSLYYSMNETVHDSQRDNSEEGNHTLSEFDATKIAETTLQNEEIPASELKIKHNESFISSTPTKFVPQTEVREQLNSLPTIQNNSVDGFLEVTKMLKQISTKLNAVQNKENINSMETLILPGGKTMHPNKLFLSPKPIVTITAPDVCSVPNMRNVIKPSKQAVPTASDFNQKRMSMRIGQSYIVQNMRKSLIPSKLEIKEKNKESPIKKLLSTKEPVKKEYLLRKSIIPKPTLSKPVISALKVGTKLRTSISNSQKPLILRRSAEKLNVPAQEKIEYSKTNTATLNNRKILNHRQSIAKLNVAISQDATSTEPKPTASLSNKRNISNFRRSIAKFQGTMNKDATTFECSKCKRKFHMESNYVTHMNTHIDSTALECKFCDKKFQLHGALQTHLREYCIKIPSKEKRLLISSTKIQMTPSSKNNSKTNSVDNITKISNSSSTSGTTGSSSIKPPGTFMQNDYSKNMKTLHSGVSRTPKKINMCKKCGKMFYNIFTLKAHTTCSESEDDETDGTPKKINF